MSRYVGSSSSRYAGKTGGVALQKLIVFGSIAGGLGLLVFLGYLPLPRPLSFVPCPLSPYPLVLWAPVIASFVVVLFVAAFVAGQFIACQIIETVLMAA